MKIVTDFYYTVPKHFWEQKLTEDALDFPTVRAVERMARHHDCHLFMVSPEELGTKKINDVTYHSHKHWEEWLPEIKRINPDVILTNGYLQISNSVVSSVPSALKIFAVHADPGQVLRQHPVTFCSDPESWKVFDLVITPIKLGLQQLSAVLPESKLRHIPFGVNINLCRQFVKPFAQREHVACGSGWYSWKGNKCVDSVLRLIQEKFGRQAGQNYGGFPKPQLFEKISHSKIFFFPSYSEGSSRILTEAAACGAMPVVALESGSCVEQAEMLGGIAIRTGMYLSPRKDQPTAVGFTRSPESIAEELINLADSVIDYRPANMDYYDANLTIKQYVNLMLGH
jgi:hypothetical protein